MGTNDPESAEYVKEKIGPDIEEQTVAGYNDDGDVVGSQTQQVEAYPVTRADVDSFSIGEAVIKEPTGDWVHGEIREFESVRDTIQSAHEHAADGGSSG